MRSRSGSRCSGGTRSGMPASRIFRFARTSRCASVASGTMNARAISGVVSPPTRLSVSATCASAASAGWQQAKISSSRSSGITALLVVGQLLRAREQLRLARERLLAADPVDRAVPRGRDDPGARVRRRAVPRPALRRDDECVLNRVLGEVEVAEDAAENCDAACTLISIGTAELVYAPFPEVVDQRAHFDRAVTASGTRLGTLDGLVESSRPR